MSRQSYNNSNENAGATVAAATQQKLTVGAVNDPLEHEADAMADKVMRMPEVPLVQRKAASCPSCGDYDDDHVRLKPLASQVTPFIQAKGADGGTVSDAVSNKIQANKGGGSPMAGNTKSFMESRFGSDFSDVRIHTGDDAAKLSGELKAQAFTYGSDIYFNSGRYNPEHSEGKHLLAHELTHVIQQSGSIGRKIQRQGIFGDFTLTTDWDVQFLQDKPSVAEMNAAPGTVLTASGLSMLNLIERSFQTNQNMRAELEGNASVEGTSEYNMALSIRRAQYIGRQIGIGRVYDVPGRAHSCQRVEGGMYACGEANAHREVNPADRRVRISMFTPSPATNLSFPTATGARSGQTTQQQITQPPAFNLHTTVENMLKGGDTGLPMVADPVNTANEAHRVTYNNRMITLGPLTDLITGTITPAHPDVTRANVLAEVLQYYNNLVREAENKKWSAVVSLLYTPQYVFATNQPPGGSPWQNSFQISAGANRRFHRAGGNGFELTMQGSLSLFNLGTGTSATGGDWFQNLMASVQAQYVANLGSDFRLPTGQWASVQASIFGQLAGGLGTNWADVGMGNRQVYLGFLVQPAGGGQLNLNIGSVQIILNGQVVGSFLSPTKQPGSGWINSAGVQGGIGVGGQF